MNDFSERLKKAMKNAGKTQADLAASIGVKQQSIQYLCSGRAKSSKYIVEIANELGVTPQSLANEVNDPGSLYNLSEGPKITRKVPLISMIQAGEWTEIREAQELDAFTEWRETTANVSGNAYALRVLGDSMTNPYGFPSIPENSVVIIEPAETAQNGQIVVALLQDSNKTTIKKYVEDAPNIYLVALNPDYKPIQVDENCKILGIAKRIELDL